MSVRANPLANQPDFWADMTQVGAGPGFATQTGNGCVIARTGIGVYTLTLEGGGSFGPTSAVGISVNGAGGRFVRIVHTSNTVKTLTCTDNGNAAAELTALRVGIWRVR